MSLYFIEPQAKVPPSEASISSASSVPEPRHWGPGAVHPVPGDAAGWRTRRVWVLQPTSLSSPAREVRVNISQQEAGMCTACYRRLIAERRFCSLEPLGGQWTYLCRDLGMLPSSKTRSPKIRRWLTLISEICESISQFYTNCNPSQLMTQQGRQIHIVWDFHDVLKTPEYSEIYLWQAALLPTPPLCG